MTDPAREALTRVELALEDATGAERLELARERLALRTAHGDRWWPGVKRWQVCTRRGAITRVTLTAFTTLPAWLAVEPVDEVQLLLPPRTKLSTVLQAPQLAGVRRLVLVHAEAGWLGALTASPVAPALESLELVSCEPEGKLVDEGALPALRRLRSTGIVRAHEWVDTWTHVEQLTELDLPGSFVRLALAKQLAARPATEARYRINGVRDDLSAKPGDARVVGLAPNGDELVFMRVGDERWTVEQAGLLRDVRSYGLRIEPDAATGRRRPSTMPFEFRAELGAPLELLVKRFAVGAPAADWKVRVDAPGATLMLNDPIDSRGLCAMLSTSDDARAIVVAMSRTAAR